MLKKIPIWGYYFIFPCGTCSFVSKTSRLFHNTQSEQTDLISQTRVWLSGEATADSPLWRGGQDSQLPTSAWGSLPMPVALCPRAPSGWAGKQVLCLKHGQGTAQGRDWPCTCWQDCVWLFVYFPFWQFQAERGRQGKGKHLALQLWAVLSLGPGSRGGLSREMLLKTFSCSPSSHEVCKAFSSCAVWSVRTLTSTQDTLPSTSSAL